MTRVYPPTQIAPLLAHVERRRAQTHCARAGHLLVRRSGQKRCPQCHAESSRRYRLRKKLERASLCAKAFPHTQEAIPS